MSKKRTPGVVFQPQVARGFQSGVNQLVSALAPTLGPLPRTVVSQRGNGATPELLDDGATIARRMLALRGRDQDVGAMYLRQMIWKVHELAGDGTTTAALLFQAVYNGGLRYLASGGSAMLLRRSLEAGAQVIAVSVDAMTTPLEGGASLTGLAHAICGDLPLAQALGEIFDIIGEHGRLEVRKGNSREIDVEYIDGVYWSGGLISKAAAGEKIFLEDIPILITDFDVKEVEAIVPLVRMMGAADVKTLLLLVAGMAEPILTVLNTPANRQHFQIIPLKAPVLTNSPSREGLHDLALLTGGKALLQGAGDRLETVRREDLGWARRAWADREYFGIVGGKGDSRALRQLVAELRTRFDVLEDLDDRKRLQERFHSVLSGTATLHVGALTRQDIDARTELAKQTAEAVRGAIREGVVPGGGVALLECQPALRQCMDEAASEDERAAYRILLRAVEAPLRALVGNAGVSPDEILARLALAEAGYGFDVQRGEIAEMRQAGIFDAASVVRTAAHAAIHSAALALTIDVIVHRASPPKSTSP